MARFAQDREDLLRDGRALLPRAQLQVRFGECNSPVFVGFRGESLSIYFGADPVYHFNWQRQLRRAYIAGRLVKAERGQLVALERRPGEAATYLVRHEFDADSQRRLIHEIERRLERLRAALDARDFVLQGHAPPEGDPVTRLAEWLAACVAIVPATSPGVG